MRSSSHSRPRASLTGELVCYARSVVNGEWNQMRAGTQGDAINPWGVALFTTFRGSATADRGAAVRL